MEEAESRKILMTGNEAIAAGSIQAGCRFYAGYPITPQNELIAYMASHMEKTGGIFIQAESELAAINMVFGASAAGARAMTSSSSPGISLKQEGISYIAGAQLPAVIVNIMRGGPGLGNIAPAQSDYFQATKGGGHGDYHCIVLAPSSVQECYTMMQYAFDAADTYRMPVIVLGDGILGQMMEPVLVDSRESVARSKELSTTDSRLSTNKPWALTGCKDREPRVVKSFYLEEGALEKFNLMLQKKYRLIQEIEQQAQSVLTDDARVIIVAYGTLARVAQGAVAKVRREGKKAGLIRPISLWPFPQKQLQRSAESKNKPVFVVVEMSYGQMVEDVRLAVQGRAQVEFLGRSAGGVPSEEEIIDTISPYV